MNFEQFLYMLAAFIVVVAGAAGIAYRMFCYFAFGG